MNYYLALLATALLVASITGFITCSIGLRYWPCTVYERWVGRYAVGMMVGYLSLALGGGI